MKYTLILLLLFIAAPSRAQTDYLDKDDSFEANAPIHTLWVASYDDPEMVLYEDSIRAYYFPQGKLPDGFDSTGVLLQKYKWSILWSGFSKKFLDDNYFLDSKYEVQTYDSIHVPIGFREQVLVWDKGKSVSVNTNIWTAFYAKPRREVVCICDADTLPIIQDIIYVLENDPRAQAYQDSMYAYHAGEEFWGRYSDSLDHNTDEYRKEALDFEKFEKTFSPVYDSLIKFKPVMVRKKRQIYASGDNWKTKVWVGPSTFRRNIPTWKLPRQRVVVIQMTYAPFYGPSGGLIGWMSESGKFFPLPENDIGHLTAHDPARDTTTGGWDSKHDPHDLFDTHYSDRRRREELNKH